MWVLVALVAVQTAIASEFFLTAGNLANFAGQLVPTGFAALGQAAAVLAGMIDLSVGATARLAALLTAGLIDDHPERVVPVLLLVLAASALIGLVNGLMVVKLRFDPLIATLISFTVLSGVALAYTRTPIGGIPTEASRFVNERILGLPYAAWFLLLLFLAMGVLLTRTRFGRNVYAVGGNLEVARRAGVSVERVRVTMMVICSVMAGLAGITLAFRQGTGDPRVAAGLELVSIVAVVVGGVSIFGGRGTMLGVLGGVVFINILRNAMNLQEVPPLIQGVITGVITIIAVVVFSRRER